VELITLIFGEEGDLTVLQMSTRAAVVFFVTLAFIRISGRRSFGQRTPFDAATTVLLGAVLSRGVVGASPFGATVAAAAVLVVLHRLLGWLSVRSDLVDVFINGRERVIVSDGNAFPEALAAALVTSRVTFWGALAMAVTAGVGFLFGTTV
jgi:uncharacterized membrane protein YcaP (DUF421 family)